MMKARSFSEKIDLVVLILALFAAAAASGCASGISTAIQPPITASSEDLKNQINRTVEEIRERNSSVEDSHEWIERSYIDFMVKNLADIADGDYQKYSKYLDEGAVYLIVHPAYYTFFQDDQSHGDRGGPDSAENALEKFIGDTSISSKTKLIQLQEKSLRDFLEYKSTEKKLIILVLPRGYREYGAYKYKKDHDEYMRYINEATNEADSVIYLYSRRPNRGTLTDKDKRRLLKFLYAVRPQSILLGGGYIGRCMEDFYKELEQLYSEDKLFVVPEITAVSPSDISPGLASEMLDDDQGVNISKLTRSIGSNILGNQDIVPKLRSLGEKLSPSGDQ